MGLILEVKNLTKKFGGLTAVNDVNFEVERGEMLGLIGPNGAGKTTLFHLISGFERPNNGSVFFDGIDITKKKPHQIVNLGMSRTFQLVKSFHYLSLLDNISVACLSPRGKEAFGKKTGRTIWKFRRGKTQTGSRIHNLNTLYRRKR